VLSLLLPILFQSSADQVITPHPLRVTVIEYELKDIVGQLDCEGRNYWHLGFSTIGQLINSDYW